MRFTHDEELSFARVTADPYGSLGHMSFRCTARITLRRAAKGAQLLPFFLSTACSDAGRHDPTPATSGYDASNPTGQAYAALVRGDYAALPGVIAALDAAVAQEPNDESNVFYAGVMRLWRFTQRADDPSYTNADFAADLQTATSDLDKARKLAPGDPHAAGFYGILEVNTGKVDNGRQDLEAAVPLYPAYIHGIQALAFGALAKTHADFPRGADALAATLAACNIAAPDGGAPSAEYSTSLPADRLGTCSDEGVVAHVWEGFWLTYGDIYAKKGDASAARTAYGNAKNAPRYNRWTLTDVLDKRLTDVDHRVQLYTDSDPSNDPTTWMEEGHICVGCHANTP
jgi:hypothetical protein